MVPMVTGKKKWSGRIVHLSIRDVAEALDSCTYDTRYIPNLVNQEIIELSEYVMTDEEIHDISEEIDGDESGRYVQVPIRTDARVGYADMQLFIETLEDQGIRNLADETIRGSGDFRRFKGFISSYPNLERQWYTWKENRTCLRALEWLEGEGLILMKID